LNLLGVIKKKTIFLLMHHRKLQRSAATLRAAALQSCEHFHHCRAAPQHCNVASCSASTTIEQRHNVAGYGATTYSVVSYNVGNCYELQRCIRHCCSACIRNHCNTASPAVVATCSATLPVVTPTCNNTLSAATPTCNNALLAAAVTRLTRYGLPCR
jgi:hypothetical protein